MITETVAPVVNPGEARRLSASNPAIRFLDVRTPAEYETLHIEGAYNVPLDRLGEHAAELCSNLADPVILVCQTGGRAKKADTTLRQAGMNNLHLLEGGVNAWVSSDLPVVRGAKRVSLERQVRMVAGAMVAVSAVLALLVNPWFALVPAFVGSGLLFSGATDTCTMGMVLAKLPYNRPATCDVELMVRELMIHRPGAVSATAGSV
jgi:rhodanese-related sulfurtransferase